MFGYRSLVSCDVQPRYAGGVPFKMEDFVVFLRKFDKVLYLFNNKNIGVSDTVDSVKEMLRKAGATDQDFERINFRPKVYYYFRDILDEETTSYRECLKLLKIMILRGVSNAYELTRTDLEKCLTDKKLVDDILMKRKHFYYDPALATDLLNYNYCEEVGGFENECNIEINLYMDAIGMTYKKNYDFIF